MSDVMATENTEKTPRPRKTAAVKKVAVKKAPAKKAAAKKAAVKVPAPARIESSPVLQTVEKKRSASNSMIVLFAFILIATNVITYSVSKNSGSNIPKDDQISFAAQVSGGVALTEAELIADVKKLNRVVYWTGSQNGAKYTLNAATTGQVYVRYLPNGKGLSDTAANYRVIATYDVNDAYTSTKAAANTSNGISITNPEGAAVFYKKDTPTNVYVAFQNLNYQMEIYDPGDGVSIGLASGSGALKQIPIK